MNKDDSKIMAHTDVQVMVFPSMDVTTISIKLFSTNIITVIQCNRLRSSVKTLMLEVRVDMGKTNGMIFILLETRFDGHSDRCFDY